MVEVERCSVELVDHFLTSLLSETSLGQVVILGLQGKGLELDTLLEEFIHDHIQVVKFEPLVELQDVKSEMDQSWTTVNQALDHADSRRFEKHWDQIKACDVFEGDLSGRWEALLDRHREGKAQFFAILHQLDNRAFLWTVGEEFGDVAYYCRQLRSLYPRLFQQSPQV